MKKSDWRERFDEEFHCSRVGCDCSEGIGSIVAVKDFIEVLIEETEERWRERRTEWAFKTVGLVDKARQEEREKVLDEVNSVLDSLLVEDEFYGKSIAEIQVEMIVNMIKELLRQQIKEME